MTMRAAKSQAIGGVSHAALRVCILLLLALCVGGVAVDSFAQAGYVWPKARPDGSVYEDHDGDGKVSTKASVQRENPVTGEKREFTYIDYMPYLAVGYSSGVLNTGFGAGAGYCAKAPLKQPYPGEFTGAMRQCAQWSGDDIWAWNYMHNNAQGLNISNLLPKCHETCGVAMMYPSDHCAQRGLTNYRRGRGNACPAAGTKVSLVSMRCEVKEPCKIALAQPGGNIVCPDCTFPVELYEQDSPVKPWEEHGINSDGVDLRNNFRFIDRSGGYGGAVEGQKVVFACHPIPGCAEMDTKPAGAMSGNLPALASSGTAPPDEPVDPAGETPPDTTGGGETPPPPPPPPPAPTGPCPGGTQEVCNDVYDPGDVACLANCINVSDFCMRWYCGSQSTSGGTSACNPGAAYGYDPNAYARFQQCTTQPSSSYYYTNLTNKPDCNSCRQPSTKKQCGCP